MSERVGLVEESFKVRRIGEAVWAREFRHLTLRSVTGTAQRTVPTEEGIFEL